MKKVIRKRLAALITAASLAVFPVYAWGAESEEEQVAQLQTANAELLEKLEELSKELEELSRQLEAYKHLLNDAFGEKPVEAAIEMVAGVPLSSMDVFYWYSDSDRLGYRMWDKNTDADNTGAEHENGFVFLQSDYLRSSNSRELVFLTNRQFDCVSGTITVTLEAKNNTIQAKLMVYGDDDLLYTSEILKGGVLPIQFTVAITDVTQLKFVLQNIDGGEGSQFALVDTILY